MLKARRIDDYKGKRMFKVPVKIRCNDSRLCRTVAEIMIEVIAPSAAAAANWVNDQNTRPETEIFAYGPQGGEVYRYTGWESSVWKQMCAQRAEVKQLGLFW